MIRTLPSLIALFVLSCSLHAQTLQDGFEGNGNITNWAGDDCQIDTSFPNPFPQGSNSSATVLSYVDFGGLYANVRFDVDPAFDLSVEHTFSLKIYVPSSGLTGNQPNQVSLKLQNRNLDAPWSTQSEIIKPIETDQWQTVTFDFASDNYINLSPDSPPPTQRTDFNRVLIQVNGEDNTDQVTAYIDEVTFEGTLPPAPVFNQLIWSDEFDENGAVDDDKWFHQTLLPQGDSWFNGEIQHYTDRIENARVEDGVLKIEARRENFTDQGHTKQFTSTRLNSKFAFQYGRVEIRAKLPTGPGTWPALWLLGKNINEDGGYWDNEGYGTTPWPACGEIDIMEHWGTDQNHVTSATHTPSSFGNTVNVGGQTIATVSTDFHVYSLEWTAEKLVFAVDDVVHLTYNPAEKNADTWPFDAEMYFLFNVAILPSISPNFSSSAMEVDYVRVYQEGPVSTTSAAAPQVRFFPNPVEEALTIELDEVGNNPVNVRLFDSSGRAVNASTQTANQGTFTLRGLDRLTPGTYQVQLQWGRQQHTFSFVKR
ncbi:MAG: family 16 glycosylhydrolase [Phaeodactylibacter sp.]|uniref:family 16 glycosylhydrolase n=1 Tax=Phaeodactylibacter sp. TaxID=1940289 RepID=UPI0032EDDB4C